MQQKRRNLQMLTTLVFNQIISRFAYLICKMNKKYVDFFNIRCYDKSGKES